MISINDTVDSAVDLLRADDRLRDVVISAAFSNKKHCNLKSKVHIAVSAYSLDAHDNAAGDDKKAGEYTVKCDIFVPLNTPPDRAYNVAQIVCSDFVSFDFISVKISPLEYNATVKALNFICFFTFYDEMILGG